ncbi:MAG: hypothetical protein ABI166_13050, partial [Mucilaginibacter sp.]
NSCINFSIRMSYYKTGIGRINKSLLKLFLMLTATVLGHRQLNTSSSSKNPLQANRSEHLQAAVLFRAAGITAYAPVIPAVWLGLVKYTWEGDIKQLAFDFESLCATLFFQNKSAEIHAIAFVQQLLFPAHYFW